MAVANNCTFIDLYARFGDCSYNADPYGLTLDSGVHFGTNLNSASSRNGQLDMAQHFSEKLVYGRIPGVDYVTDTNTAADGKIVQLTGFLGPGGVGVAAYANANDTQPVLNFASLPALSLNPGVYLGSGGTTQVDASLSRTAAGVVTLSQAGSGGGSLVKKVAATTVSSNAGTVPVNVDNATFTNSSAATMTITLTTSGAVDGQTKIVRIYDFSAVAQTISWVNTENSGVTVPTTSNGSTTLPLTVGFVYNGSTSKWRCVAVA